MKTILVIFQATQPHTESLALGFGLGAIQAGADIRLRHLEPSSSGLLAHAGYGPPRAQDLGWAEGIAVFLESSESGAVRGLSSAFEDISDDPATAIKTIFMFHSEANAESLRLIESMAKQVGIQHLFNLSGESPSAEHMTNVARSLIEAQKS